MRLAQRTLAGRVVLLEPYAPGNRDEVRAAIDCDPEAWDLFALCGSGEHFDGWWQRLTEPGWLSFAIRRRSDSSVVGSTSFLHIDPHAATVEIGATFLRPEVRGTAVNPESKLLLLADAFEAGAQRVELLTDARNMRSQAAIAKLGATLEGIDRADRVTWTGYVRDSVRYAIAAADWPQVRALLEARLAESRDERATGS